MPEKKGMNRGSEGSALPAGGDVPSPKIRDRGYACPLGDNRRFGDLER
jgi:hypothetical protein